MKFEHLIWIIIFLVYLVTVILKRVYAASKTGDLGIAKRRSEWREKLDKYLSQARQELEIAKQEASDYEYLANRVYV
jgi:F0F1-type ATP synthase membrane subunit b/b'